MRRTSLVLFLSALTALLVALPASAVPWAWSDTIGAGNGETAYALCQTSDGGFLVAGDTSSFGHGGQDGWAVKLGPSGAIEWQRAYGGSTNDSLRAVLALQDGGYLLAGYTLSFGAGSADAWLLKIDASGTIVWQNTYGGTEWDQVEGLARALDGSFVAVGSSQSFGAGDWDLWAFRVDAAGALQWQKRMGGALPDGARSVAALSDGGFLVGGYTASFGGGGSDVWAVKLDGSGSVVWQKALGGSGDDNLGGLAATPDGGGLFACTTQSAGNEIWLAKLTSTGSVEWQKTYGGGGQDQAWSASRCSDGGFLVAGTTYSFGNGAQAWAFKVNSTGTFVWQKAFGGNDQDEFFACTPTSDSGFALAGFTFSFGAGSKDFFLFKLDPSATVGGPCEDGAGTAATSSSATLASVSSTAAALDTTVSAAGVTSAGQTTQGFGNLCFGQGPLQAIADSDVTTGNAPLFVNFTATVNGGTAPYTYDWNFGDGTPHSPDRDPFHTFSSPGTFTVTLTVHDASSNTATDSHLTLTVVDALSVTASASIASGTAPLGVRFHSSVTGGTPPYSYSWFFGSYAYPTSEEADPWNVFTKVGTYSVEVTVADSVGELAFGLVTVTVAEGQQCEIWVPESSGITGDIWGMTHADSRYLGAAWNNLISSPNGTAWSTVHSETDYDMNDVAFSGSVWVAVGNVNQTASAAKILSSDNGVTWHEGEIKGASTLRGITWGNGLFVAVGNSGAIFVSPDGAQWQKIHYELGDRALLDVIWSPEKHKFVAVGATGAVRTSTDGYIWETHDWPLTLQFHSVAWNGEQFVAVGFPGPASAFGEIYTSQDGENWSVRNTSFGPGLFNVAWTGTRFVTVGWNELGGIGGIYSSRDGMNWVDYSQGPDLVPRLLCVASNGNELVAGGYGGKLLYNPGNADCLLAEPTVTPQSGVAPLQVQFAANVSGGTPPYQFQWSFGDGSAISNVQNPTHTYTALGETVAQLVVIDAQNRGFQAPVRVRPVGPLALTGASATPTVGTAPVQVQFTASAQGGQIPYVFTWDFGDGSPKVRGESVTHTYSRAGFFLAKVVVNDSSGLSAVSDPIELTIQGPFLASATANPPNGLAPLTVSFAGAVQDGQPPYSFSWDFGDSSPISTLQNPTHAYPFAGRYHVTLTVTDSASATATDSVTVQALSDILPLQGDWPTFGNGPSHGGYFPGNVCSGEVYPDWSAKLGQSGIQQVAVGGTHVFATPLTYFNESYVAALDEETGAEAWRHEFEDAFSVNPPTYDSSSVYVQRGNHGSDTQLWSLSAINGTVNWFANHQAQWERYMAPCVADRKIWVNGGYYGGMYGFNQDTGAELFYVPLPQYDQWTPAYYAGVVYSFVEGVFRAHDPVRGTPLWSIDLGWDWSGWSMNRTVAIVNNRAYVTGNPGLYCIDLQNEDLLWAVEGTFSGTPAVANGVLYVISDGALASFNATNGTPLLTGAETGLHDPIIVTDDAVIVSARASVPDAGKTYIYDPLSMEPITVIPVGGAPTVANGRLFIATGTGEVDAYLFRPCSGTCFVYVSPQATPESGLEPLQVAFTANPVFSDCQGSIQYLWNFGDGQTSTEENPSHVYSTPGMYTWQLQASAGGITRQRGGKVDVGCYLNCTLDVPSYALVDGATRFAAEGNPSGLCQGEPSNLWDFGDGQYAATNVAIHTYASRGTFTWTFTANLGSATCTRTGTVTVNNCTVECSAAVPLSGTAGVGIQFEASAAKGADCQGQPQYRWDFGNGSGSSEASPFFVYINPGTYIWKVTVTCDAATCIKSGTIEIGQCEVTCTTNVPEESWVGANIPFVSDTTVNEYCPQAVRYDWSFGDGENYLGSSLTHAYTSVGTYHWMLRATSGPTACSQSGDIKVWPKLTMALDAECQTGTPALMVTLSSNIEGGKPKMDEDGVPVWPYYTVTWDFGDGTTGEGPGILKTYMTAGIYVVHVTAKDELGQEVTDTITVTVTEGDGPPCGVGDASVRTAQDGSGATIPSVIPVRLTPGQAAHVKGAAPPSGEDRREGREEYACMSVQLTASPDKGVLPADITFSAAVTGGLGPYAYWWNFGEPDAPYFIYTSTPTVVHTFKEVPVGTYTATVIVVDYLCHPYWAKTTVTIVDPLSVFVTATNTMGTTPVDTLFHCDVTGGLEPYTYLWNFGDGSLSSAANPVHTYLNGGTYYATLTVSDAVGQTVLSDPLKLEFDQGLVSLATATPVAGASPLMVRFAGSALGGTVPYTFRWDFGDGGSSFDQSPTHLYTTVGTYRAFLKVTDAMGLTSNSATITIRTDPTLYATAEAAPLFGGTPLAVQFSSTVTGGFAPYTITWDFGDGTAGSGYASPDTPVPHTYTASGTFHPVLRVVDADGTTVTDSHLTITATLPLTATASASPASGEEPLLVSFQGGASGGMPPLTYSWNFGDGSATDTRLSPSHQYQTFGPYLAQFKVTDSFGQTASAQVAVTVAPAPPKLDWRFTADTSLLYMPTLASDGSVFVAGSNAYVYAIGAGGNLLWKKKPGGAVMAPMVFDRGVLYFPTSEKALVAYSAGGGKAWEVKFEANATSSAAVGPCGDIYIGSTDGYLYAVSVGGGLKWKFKTAGAIEASPAVAQDGTIFVVSNSSGITGYAATLYAIYPNGGLRWEASSLISSKVILPLVLDGDDNIYVSDSSGTITVVPPTRTTPPPDPRSYLWKGSVGTASPVIAQGLLLYSEDGSTNTINISDGSDGPWSSDAGAPVAPAVSADGKAYVVRNGGGADSYLVALDMVDGSALSSTKLGGGATDVALATTSRKGRIVLITAGYNVECYTVPRGGAPGPWVQYGGTSHHSARRSKTPTAFITSPANGSQVSGDVSVIYGGTVSSSCESPKVNFYIEGFKAASSDASPANFLWFTGASQDGSYTLTAECSDKAGNVVETSVNVTLTNPAPPTYTTQAPPPTFSWQPMGDNKFRVYISTDADFGSILTQSKTSDRPWLKTPGWTPTKNQWNKVLAAAGPAPVRVYWKVIGKTSGLVHLGSFYITH